MIHAFVFYKHMNRYLLLGVLLLFFVKPVSSKTDVLLTVDGVDISMPEFLAYYDKDKTLKPCSVMEYFDYFLKAKMKVMDARFIGMASDEEFLRKLNSVKASFCIEGDHSDDVSRLVKINLITYKLPQRVSEAHLLYAKNVMDDLHFRLVSEAKVTDVIFGAVGDELIFEDYGNEWTDRSFLLDEINSAIDKIAAGEISRPVYSPEGIHIVLLNQRFSNSFHDLRNEMSDMEVVLKRVEETLLISEWNKNTDLPYYRYSEGDLEKYFKNHKTDFKWKLPHYKGAVVHCSSKKVFKKLKKALKKEPLENWEKIIKGFCYYTGEKLEFDVGLFAIGNNRYVDKLAFKCGSFETLKDYPYTGIIGKCLDYELEDYKDVYDDVVTDYIKYAERCFFDDLEKKLRVEKHLDVLKTVNCSASN